MKFLFLFVWEPELRLHTTTYKYLMKKIFIKVQRSVWIWRDPRPPFLGEGGAGGRELQAGLCLLRHCADGEGRQEHVWVDVRAAHAQVLAQTLWGKGFAQYFIFLAILLQFIFMLEQINVLFSLAKHHISLNS